MLNIAIEFSHLKELCSKDWLHSTACRGLTCKAMPCCGEKGLLGAGGMQASSRAVWLIWLGNIQSYIRVSSARFLKSPPHACRRQRPPGPRCRLHSPLSRTLQFLSKRKSWQMILQRLTAALAAASRIMQKAMASSMRMAQRLPLLHTSKQWTRCMALCMPNPMHLCP